MERDICIAAGQNLSLSRKREGSPKADQILDMNRHKMNLAQPIVCPFVIVNPIRSPLLISAESRPANRFDEPTVRLEGAYVFALFELIISNDARPAVQHSRKIRVPISRIDDRRDRTTRAATHHRNREMAGKVNALVMKLLANAGAIKARQTMAAQIQRRRLAGIDIG